MVEPCLCGADDCRFCNPSGQRTIDVCCGCGKVKAWATHECGCGNVICDNCERCEDCNDVVDDCVRQTSIALASREYKDGWLAAWRYYSKVGL